MKALNDYLYDLFLRKISRGALPSFNAEAEKQKIKERISSLKATDFNLDKYMVNNISDLLLKLSMQTCLDLLQQRANQFEKQASKQNQTNPDSHPPQHLGDCIPRRKRNTSQVGRQRPTR